MCGLFGAISASHFSKNEGDMLRKVGALSFLRGDDSTGCLTRYTKGKKNHPFYNVKKSVSDPYGFLYDPTNNAEWEKQKTTNLFMGHCRAATIGDITKDNAHPYQINNLIGAHNGTVDSLKEAANKRKTTDSNIMYEMIESIGIQKTLNELPYGAAYALTWYDANEDTFHLLRNNMRPLLTVESGDTMFWSSEAVFLLLAMNRTPCISFSSQDIKEVPENMLITIPGNGNLKKLSSVEMIKERPVYTGFMSGLRSSFKREEPKEDNVKHLPLPSPSPFVGDNDTSKESDTIPAIKGEHLNTFIFAAQVFKDSNIDKYPNRIEANGKQMFLRYYHPSLGYIPYHQLAELRERGCLMEKTKVTDKQAMWWVSEDEWVCDKHKEDEMILEYYATFEDNKGKNILKRGHFIYSTIEKFLEENAKFALMKNK